MLQEILGNGFQCSEQELELLHTASGEQLLELVVKLAVEDLSLRLQPLFEERVN